MNCPLIAGQGHPPERPDLVPLRHDDAQTTLGDFQLGREIGRGGMGVVYAARQISLNRHVALKVLPFAALLDARQIARFRNEAQTAARLRHPNIVPVHFVGEERGVPYYAMQLIDGRPLDQAIEQLRGSQPSDRVSRSPNREVERDTVFDFLAGQYAHDLCTYFRTIAELAIQATEALHSAHQFGVVHRDVKPSNLLLDTQGKLWITDFGLARCRGDASLTQSGDLIGTIRYMSPEQARGDSSVVDHRTDIYSLGVTLYELLAQRHPVDARQPAAVLLKLEREEPERLRFWNSKIPVELENIVRKAMAKSPVDRYATAEEMGQDLRCFLAGRPTVARRTATSQRAVRWLRRHQRVAGSVATLLATLVACTGLLIQQNRATTLALGRVEDDCRLLRAQLAKSDAERRSPSGNSLERRSPRGNSLENGRAPASPGTSQEPNQ